MLGEIVGVVFLDFIPVNSNLFENFFIAKLIHVHVPCFGLFGFMLEFTKPSVVELSVLRGVGGFF